MRHQPGQWLPESGAGGGARRPALRADPGELLIIPLGGGHGCNWFLQVQPPPAVSDYEAVMYSDVSLGTRWWASPGTTWPARMLGIGA